MKFLGAVLILVNFSAFAQNLTDNTKGPFKTFKSCMNKAKSDNEVARSVEISNCFEHLDYYVQKDLTLENCKEAANGMQKNSKGQKTALAKCESTFQGNHFEVCLAKLEGKSSKTDFDKGALGCLAHAQEDKAKGFTYEKCDKFARRIEPRLSASREALNICKATFPERIPCIQSSKDTAILLDCVRENEQFFSRTSCLDTVKLSKAGDSLELTSFCNNLGNKPEATSNSKSDSKR